MCALGRSYSTRSQSKRQIKWVNAKELQEAIDEHRTHPATEEKEDRRELEKDHEYELEMVVSFIHVLVVGNGGLWTPGRWRKHLAS